MATEKSKGKTAWKLLKDNNKKIRELMIENKQLERNLTNHFSALGIWKERSKNKNLLLRQN